MIFDIHTHTFPAYIAGRVLHELGVDKARIIPFTDGTVDGLKASMRENGIDYSVVLTVMTNLKQVPKLNGLAIQNRDEQLKEGILTFGGLHPDYADYKTQIKQLAENGIRGIKLHPPYQGIDMDDIRYLRIIDAATEAGLAISVHAGIDIGIYDRNYCSVPHILKVIQEVHPEKLILAHMGNWGYWDQVEEYLCGAPVYMDTAFSIGQCHPNPESKELPIQMNKLSEEDFIRIIRKHGTDKILFGTDSPWGDQKEEVSFFKNMAITEEERDQIFYQNAVRLLNLTLKENKISL